MKSILLATTALVAFAGAAAADGHASISFSMSTTLGFNDTDSNEGRTSGDEDDPDTADVDESLADFDNEVGFYWEGNLTTTATAALDNGLTAGAQFEITINEDDAEINNDNGLDLSSSDFVLSLEAENGGVFFGDTGRAAEQHWTAAGDMEADGVSTGSDSAVLRGDIGFGPVDTSISYLINDSFADAGDDPVEQLSVGASAEFGNFFASLAYQEESDFADSSDDFNGDEIIGVSGGGTFAGATVTVAYAENSTDEISSTGVQVAYPFGPVTTTVYYVSEDTGDDDDGTADDNFGAAIAYSDGPISVTLDYDNDQGTEKVNLDGSYEVGSGITLFAGAQNENEGDDTDFYVAGTYDLGGGAQLLISFAQDDDGDQEDEIGADDYQEGTTVELTFAF
ncbi:MAG: porin [Pseudomonadota bacterium]